MKSSIFSRVFVFVVFACIGEFFGKPTLELKETIVRSRGSASYRLTGFDVSEKEYAFLLRVFGDNGVDLITPGEKRVSLKAGASKWFDVPEVKKYGPYTITIEGKDGTKLVRKFVYLPAKTGVRATRGEFQFGIHEEPYRYPWEDREVLMRYASECGISLLRSDGLGTSWREVEPKDGVWKFTNADKNIALAEKYGLNLLLLIGGVPFENKRGVDPNWKPLKVDPKYCRWQSLPDAKKYAVYASKLAEHYGNRVMMWEIGNEPDIFNFANYTLDEYLNYFHQASRAIKKACPGAVVMNGGLASNMQSTSGTDSNYGLHLLQKADPNLMDLYALHCHGSFDGLAVSVKKLKADYELTHFPNPVFFSETALTSAGCGEYVQAETLWKKLLYAWSIGARGYVWYNLRGSTHYPETHSEACYGILTQSMDPKPVFAAYHTLTSHLTGATFVRTLSKEKANEMFFLFKGRNGDWLIPFWNIDDKARTLSFLNIGGGKATLIDMWGNEGFPKNTRGSIAVEASKRPALLRISGRGSKEPTFMGTPMQITKEFVVALGKKTPSEIRITNLFSKQWKGTLQFNATAGVSATPASSSFVLKPGESKLVKVLLDAPEALEDGRIPELKIGLKSSEVQAELTYPVKVFRKADNHWSVKPDFVLNTREQVVQVIPPAPENVTYEWKGVKDLSADVRLMADEHNLHIRIVVQDDVHSQKSPAETMFEGDSVQIGFSCPGQDGTWELGCAMGNDGKVMLHVWKMPKGFFVDETMEDYSAIVSRDDKTGKTVYNLSIRYRTLGFSLAEKGILLNVLVNDNDGQLRENFIRLTPGMGDGTMHNTFPWASFGF